VLSYIGTGDRQTPATGNPAKQNYLPVWSPDGSKIAFTTNRDGNPEIYVMNRDGSGVRRMTNSPQIDVSPTWSPTGAQLAWVSDRTGTPKIYIMNVDGTGQRPLIKAVFGASLADGWLYEMRLGLDGVMTGMAMYADLMARLWDLHVRGDADAVRDAYSRFLLMRNINESIPGADLYKALLKIWLGDKPVQDDLKQALLGS